MFIFYFLKFSVQADSVLQVGPNENIVSDTVLVSAYLLF